MPIINDVPLQFTQEFKVGQILMTADGSLIFNKSFPANISDVKVAEFTFLPLPPYLVILQTVQNRDDINTDRRKSKLNDFPRQKVFFRHVDFFKTKIIDGF